MLEDSALARCGIVCDAGRMFVRILLSLVVFTGCLFAEDAYEIRLARAMKAGDRFDVSVKMALDDSVATSFDGDEVENNQTVVACRLTGELNIVAVTSKGQPMEVRLKLKTVECIEDGQPSAFFKAGDELHLKKDEPDNLAEVNGEPAEDIQTQVIESILSVESEGDVSDDDVFGTKEKVKVGAEWPLNAKAAMADFARQGITELKPEDFTGTAKLMEVTTFANQPALRVRMESKVNAKGGALSSLPETVKAVRFLAELSGEIDLPTDLHSNSGKTKGMSKLEVDGVGKIEQDGVEKKVAVKIRRRVATELTGTQVK